VPIAFISVGHVAAAVGSEMKTFLDPIMANIKEGLLMRGLVALAPLGPRNLFQFSLS
jgi:hypothetical protein